MIDKIREKIVASPLLVTVVTFAIGIAVEWLTAFMRSISTPPV